MKNKKLAWIIIIAAVFVALTIAVAVIFSPEPDVPAVTPDDPSQTIVVTPGTPNTPDAPDNPVKPTEALKIYIDPGHGFGDPGTVYELSDGLLLKEADITLDLSKLVVEKLAAKGFDVRISHDSNEMADNADTSSNTKMTLQYRYNDANEWGAHLFLSIHVNSYPASSDVNGIRSFFAVSKKTTFKSASKLFCTLINENCVENVGEAPTSVSGVDYTVLKYADMPASLLEIGFITNPEDRANMQSSVWLGKMADGIVNGIIEFTESDTFKPFK